MKTTLNKIKEHNPCENGWKKLLTFLNKTEADDEELSLLTILESNGFNDALWSLRVVEGYDKEIRLMACDFAESVLHLTNDERSVNAIKVSRDYANGLATLEELTAASDAASDAARDAARAASYASYAASAAARAASYAASAAAWAARDAAREAMDAEREKQIEIFKKYVNQELSGTISSQGANGLLNIPNGSNNTGTSAQYPKCLKCNKQKTLYWSGTPSFASSFFCTCNEPVKKSDLEILQDEVKSLTKRVDKLIKQLNK